MAKHFPKDYDPFEDLNDEPVVVPMVTYTEQKSIPVWLDLLLTALITVAVVVVMRIFVADTYQVPTGSMLETIQLGDRLVGEKISYRFRTPKAGEVVTFDDPSDPSVTLIKRVIATEGQTVDIDFALGIVYVDGEALDEPYINDLTYTPEGTEFPLRVPEGKVFLMGDNRNRSTDSRDSRIGTLDKRELIGKAVVLLFPGKNPMTEQRDFSRIGLLKLD